ncbi:hypothetical protein IEO21_07834 [Rhodonia placenta]|uniref:Uncharacterized protein n=1 Tax=Rhodonia placenta TaxID=104341 RepID=A0A8H7NXR5_9APHY|nr:hypothetical protein IEO21_07834 [Postia placenta]
MSDYYLLTQNNVWLPNEQMTNVHDGLSLEWALTTSSDSSFQERALVYFSSRGSQGIPLLDLSKLDNADDPAFSAESIGTPGKVQKVQIRFIVREYLMRSPDKMVTLFEPTGCVDISPTYAPRQVTIKTRTNVVTTKRLAEFVQKEIREVYERFAVSNRSEKILGEQRIKLVDIFLVGIKLVSKDSIEPILEYEPRSSR